MYNKTDIIHHFLKKKTVNCLTEWISLVFSYIRWRRQRQIFKS